MPVDEKDDLLVLASVIFAETEWGEEDDLEMPAPLARSERGLRTGEHVVGSAATEGGARWASR